jgi:23S rRNA (cytosine1962-C5)-methyltransferase
MAKFYLIKKIGDRVVNGHPWVFANELGDSEGEYKAGDIVDVHSSNGTYIGSGYINPSSLIRIRILTRNKQEPINEEFFYNKLLAAWEYRKQLGYVENCRLIFGEADGMPALIIDKFNDYFVIQSMALGIDLWKQAIVDALKKIFNPKGIYERNDVPVRELEGLQQIKGFLSEPFDTNIIINENGLQFHVDIANGQKTGYFLDQQDNRRAIANIVKGASVLEAFCYTGTFSVHAAHYGAKKVLGLDISEQAVEKAKANALLNGYHHICDFKAVNAFDYLKQIMCVLHKLSKIIPAIAAGLKDSTHLVTGYTASHVPARA